MRGLKSLVPYMDVAWWAPCQNWSRRARSVILTHRFCAQRLAFGFRRLPLLLLVPTGNKKLAGLWEENIQLSTRSLDGRLLRT